MTMLLFLLGLMASADSEHRIHSVDVIVINTVRSYTTEQDRWGRTRIIPHSQLWVSYFQHGIPPLWFPFLVDRGWNTGSSVLAIVQCSDGWMVVLDGYSVTAPSLLLIDSNYDWELRNRRVYIPFTR